MATPNSALRGGARVKGKGNFGEAKVKYLILAICVIPVQAAIIIIQTIIKCIVELEFGPSKLTHIKLKMFDTLCLSLWGRNAAIAVNVMCYLLI